MSWLVSPLNSLCDIQMGSAPSGSTYVDLGEGVPLIAGAADYGDITPNPKKATTEPTRLTKSGDIILCVRATIGDLNWADGEYCLGRGVAGLRAEKNKLDSKYLWYFLLSHNRELYKQANGSTFPQINREVIENIPVPLPPLATQKRIARMLEQADQLRKQAQQMESELNQLAQSLFLEMFGDPVKNSKGWELKPIKNVATITTGNTPSRSSPEYYGDYIEWIKSDNINTPSHYLTAADESLSKEGAKVGRMVESGAVLMTCIAGSPDCIGNVAIADRTVAFNQQINAVTPSEGMLTTDYFYMLCVTGKKLIQQASTNSMKGMVSKGNLEKVHIPVPPFDIQKSFARKFSKIRSEVEVCSKQVVECEVAFNSLMQRAFNGELTTPERKAA